jgi:hypothetical protein
VLDDGGDGFAKTGLPRSTQVIFCFATLLTSQVRSFGAYVPATGTGVGDMRRVGRIHGQKVAKFGLRSG